MKVLIFGASVKNGMQLVKQSLELDHQVIAYVRRENSIDINHENLEVIVGNLGETDKIEQLVEKSDACISALGGNSLTKHAIDFIKGIENIVAAMQKNEGKKFLYLSSVGASESRFYMNQPIRFLVCDLMLRIPLADHSKNEKMIMESNIEWTIFRPGGLTEGDLSVNLNHGAEKTVLKGNPQISRASLASFMLKQLSNKSYSNKAVWLYEN